MNILIVGEYSGFAKNLKEGFTNLGHITTVVTGGDGYKKISISNSDVLLEKERVTIFQKNIKLVKYLTSAYYSIKVMLKLCLKFTKYDCIIIINSEFVNLNIFHKAAVNFYFLKILLKKNGKFFLSGCGDDTAYYEFINSSKYNPYTSNGANFLPYINNSRYKLLFHKIFNSIDIVVPIMYDYYRPLLKFRNRYFNHVLISNPIRLPYVLPVIKDEYYCLNGKIKILYINPKATNKKKLKGSNFIVEALERINDKYSEYVDVQVFDSLTFDVYLRKVIDADVILDQCFSYGQGMNAVIGLAYGKVVLGGNETEDIELFRFQKNPVINILPDSNQIFLELEKLILDKNRIVQIKKESRKFAEEHLDCKVIAQKYIDLL